MKDEGLEVRTVGQRERHGRQHREQGKPTVAAWSGLHGKDEPVTSGRVPAGLARPAAEVARLLTADDVADILRVGRSTVYEWARRGDLPCVVLHRGRGRNVRRWEPAALEAFIAAGRQEPGRRLSTLHAARSHALCTQARGLSAGTALERA